MSRAVELLSALAEGEIRPEARRGPGPPFNPFAQALEETDRPEAVWLAFLATHLGWDRPDSCGVLYRGLTERPLWTWPALSRDGGAAFARWVGERWPELARLAPFGNHRKIFSHNPAVPVSTAWVVRSYVSWAADGLPNRRAGRAHTAPGPQQTAAPATAGARSDRALTRLRCRSAWSQGHGHTNIDCGSVHGGRSAMATLT